MSVVLNVKRCLDCREYVAYTCDRVVYGARVGSTVSFGPNFNQERSRFCTALREWMKVYRRVSKKRQISGWLSSI